jgi:hypothetical protein
MQKFLFELTELRLGKRRIQRFSINTTLTDQLSNFFRRPVHLLPMPVLEDWSIMMSNRQLNAKKITLLWPGEPHPRKGASIIQKLTRMQTPLAADFVFVVGDMKITSPPGSAEVQLMGTKIPRQSYLHWFKTADCVILPYSPMPYKETCSSVFIEAVCAGLVPLVSADTWMARELQSAGLQECIIDWHAPNVFEVIHRVARDVDVQQKLAEMTKLYRNRHSPENTGAIFETMYSLSA